MTNDRTLDSDWLRAGNVLQAIEGFADTVADENALQAVSGTLDGDGRLKGGHVGTPPERFTESALIEPCLEALGYTAESQPVELVRDERKRPDFELVDVDDRCTVIVESKAFNRETTTGAGRADIEAYLDANTFAKYRTDLDVRYLIGIATDGVQWLLYGKELTTGAQAGVGACRLEDTIREVLLDRRVSDEHTEGPWREAERQELADEFVPLFASDYLLANVERALSE